MIEKLAHLCNDEIEFREYHRLCPLKMDPTGPIDMRFDKITAGDCIIGFDRSTLFDLKHQIETQSMYRSCIIYGNLPPANRRAQAILFNTSHHKKHGYNVMVASDAIGMGLNLNIKRIIFADIHKFSAQKGGRSRLTDSEIIQIAGRAGRFGMYDEGFVTTLHRKDYHIVKKVLQNPYLPTVNKAVLRSKKK